MPQVMGRAGKSANIHASLGNRLGWLLVCTCSGQCIRHCAATIHVKEVREFPIGSCQSR
jgi:hypothetical protein